jgi:hypothetical protein
MTYNTSDGHLYGMSSDSDGLFRVDPDNGSYDVISVSGVPEVTNGLAYNTGDGYLYGAGSPRRITIPGNGCLFRIDLTDSSCNFISSTPFCIIELAYNNSNGYLYGIGGSYLYRIDPTNGSFTQVSDETGFGYGLTFNSSDGYLYSFQGTPYPYPPGNTPGSLYRIDPADGSYILVSDKSAPNVVALAYIPEPATLLLLALGSLLLTRRRRQ